MAEELTPAQQRLSEPLSFGSVIKPQDVHLYTPHPDDPAYRAGQLAASKSQKRDIRKSLMWLNGYDDWRVGLYRMKDLNSPQ